MYVSGPHRNRTQKINLDFEHNFSPRQLQTLCQRSLWADRYLKAGQSKAMSRMSIPAWVD